MESSTDDTRKIIINLTNNREPVNNKSNKPCKKRVITATDKWSVTVLDTSPIRELELIGQLLSNHQVDTSLCNIITRQIAGKISGYRSQDIKKTKYSKLEFITCEQVLQKMIESNNLCYYCKNSVKVLYENVREPKQWTLERIDNDYGHNNENVVIACLDCNLHRRTMYHERYIFTKQLRLTKTDS
jgi:hypothetical protein